MSTRITDTDHGAKALAARIAKMKKGQVDVGIFADQGSAQKNKASAGLTVLDVASFHEFGLGVPERSFLRGYVDENKQRVRGMIKALAAQVDQGKLTQEMALERLGMTIVGEIQKRISQGIPPPNAPATIARKGSSTPLIDTGQLRSSITHKVRT